MADTAVMSALRTGTEERQTDQQIAMALQALSLRQKQEAGREQEQAQQQRLQGAKYVADRAMASPPPQAMAPGQPSVPMQPPQQGGVPPPPMGGSMMSQPQPQQAPPIPPQQPMPWMTGKTAPPSLGGQPPPPVASGQLSSPPAAPNTGIDMPKIRDPKEIFKTIDTTPELANLPLDEKGRLADAMAETMSKQNKAVVEQWKIGQEVKEAQAKAGKQAESAAMRKLFRGIDPTPEMKNAYFATGDIDQAMGMVRKEEAKKGIPPKYAGGGAGTGTGGGGGASVPGGVGSEMLQDRNTGQKYAVNNRSGKAWEYDDATDKWKPVSPNAVPKDATKIGNIGAMGARESVFTQRVMISANEAAKDLENVAELPLAASTGLFAGRKQGPGLMDATKEALTNKATTQDVQSYNVMATGFQRSLATIESAGLAPPGSLSHQMDTVLLKEGDTNQTKLEKMAQTRQIVEAGLDVLKENPRVSQSEKDKVDDILAKVRKAVPFTQRDLLKLNTKPGATLRSVMPKSGDDDPAPPKESRVPGVTQWRGHTWQADGWH